MSCLFNSLSRELQNKNIHSISSSELRQEACNYLHHDFPIISGMSTHELLNITHGDYSEYILNMRRNNSKVIVISLNTILAFGLLTYTSYVDWTPRRGCAIFIPWKR